MKKLGELSVEYMLRYGDLKYAMDQFFKERIEIIDEVRKSLRRDLIKSGINANAISDYDYDETRAGDHVTDDNWGCLISRKYRKYVKNAWASGIGLCINPQTDEWKCGYNPHLFFWKSRYLSDYIIEKVTRLAKSDQLSVIYDGESLSLVNHLPVEKGIDFDACLKMVNKFPALFIKYDDFIAINCK